MGKSWGWWGSAAVVASLAVTSALAAPGATSHAAAPSAAAPTDPWTRLPALLARIHPPTFPALEVRITDRGAVGDGVTDCIRAINAAIAEVHARGGGRVTVPPGRFLTGALRLRGGVDLHLEAGATLLFSQDPRQYLPAVPTRYEGNDCLNYSPFVYALNETNVAITGQGTLDGRAATEAWRAMKRETRHARRLRELAERGVPVERRVFGPAGPLRPNLVEFHGCAGVLVDGVTLRNGPMWTVHPLLCRNVTIRRVRIETSVPNGDGIDPESCADVHIHDCTFATRDDAIALKAGRNADGRRVNVPCENVVIQRCEIRGAGDTSRNGIAVGSELSAGVRNVFVEDCSVSDRVRGISLKSNTLRGGFIEDVYFRRMRFQRLEEAALLIDLEYGGETGPHPPRVARVELRDSTVDGAERIWEVATGDPAAVTGLSLVDCDFRNIAVESAPRYLAGLTLTRTRHNGQFLTAQARPLFPSRPGVLGLLLAAGCASLTGWLAAKAHRRYWMLPLILFWAGCAALLQAEPAITGLLDRPLPIVENARVGITWCLAAFVAAAFRAMLHLRRAERQPARRQVPAKRSA